MSPTKLRECMYRWRRGYSGDLKGRLFDVRVDLGLSCWLVRNGERLERAACGHAPTVLVVSPS